MTGTKTGKNKETAPQGRGCGRPTGPLASYAAAEASRKSWVIAWDERIDAYVVMGGCPGDGAGRAGSNGGAR